MKSLRLSAEPPHPLRSHRASETWKNPKVKLTETPMPQVGARDLLLKVEYVGLCGSDFHLAEPTESGAISYPGLLELPVTLGHEFSAAVVDYGSAINAEEKARFPIGTPVTAEEMFWCGECHACRSGNPNHCENLEELGFTRDGAHTEYVSVGIKYCWSLGKLADSIGRDGALKAGALTEPYAVAFRSLFQGAQGNRWLPGNNLVIFGAGPIGLAALDLALAAGALRVVVIETSEARRKLAEELGANAVLQPSGSLGAKIREILGSEADWILDAAGATETIFPLAAEILGIGGSICLLARTESNAGLDPEILITKNARVFGSQGHSGEHCFGRVIDLMAEKKLHPLKLIGETISLREAEERLNSHLRAAGKILVRPSQELSV